MQSNIRRISGTIESRGRKYFHIRVNNKYKAQLVIDENTCDLQPGDTFDFQATQMVEHSNYGNKYTYTKASPELLKQLSDEAHQQEIQRWTGYVENAFSEGRVYQKGLDTLKRLGVDISIYDERIVEVQLAKKQAAIRYKIARYKGYVKEALAENRLYENGIDILHSLGCHDLDEEIEQVKKIVSTYATFYFNSGYHIKKGQIFVDDGKCYEIVTCSYHNDIGYGSIGTYHNTFDCDYITIANARNISNTTDGQARINAANLYNILIEDLKVKETRYWKFVEKLLEYVVDNGNSPSFPHSSSNLPDSVDFTDRLRNTLHYIKSYDVLYVTKDDWVDDCATIHFKAYPIDGIEEIISKLIHLKENIEGLKHFINDNTTQICDCYKPFAQEIFVNGDYNNIDTVEYDDPDLIREWDEYINNFEQYINCSAEKNTIKEVLNHEN